MIKTKIYASLYLSFILFLLSNCRDKTIEEYYSRPENLADPIYQQLESRGNFKNYLALVEKADYKRTLSGAGYWTVFAPNDEAFRKFFETNGISNIDAIDKIMASNIVRYSLIYNSFNSDRLSAYQSNLGWVEEDAFKRRTAYYEGVYISDEIKVGDQLLSQQKVVSSNRNGFYFPDDNNNKYLPYFLSAYFQNKNLSAVDYNYFYPDKEYTGFNVSKAKVINANIPAENGFVHEIDEVILPLQSIESYLYSKPEYSKFRELYEKYMVVYSEDNDATRKYQVLMGISDPVFVKYYNGELVYSPNNENFLKESDNDGQRDGWSIFVPTNDQLNDYLNNVILEHYESLDKIPRNIIRDFLNAHMWPTTVWPTKFTTTSNDFGEPARFNTATDIVDAKILSNGFFYGTNKVQEANVFHTVFGKAYLDPDYSMMVRALEGDLKITISNPAVRFTMFLIKNDALAEAGFSWDDRFLHWVYTPPAGGAVLTGGQAQLRLQRIIYQHIAFTFQNELDDLEGTGIVETYGGEYIRYENGEVYAAGNLDAHEKVWVAGPVETSNGVVYYTDRILNFSDKKISEHLGENPEYSYFYNYLINSILMYDASTKDIKGVSTGTLYTVFVPTNEAIKEAIMDGYLPGNDGVPDYNPASAGDRDKIANFIQYHILANENIVTDGRKDGSYESIYRNLEGEVGMLRVLNAPDNLQVTDSYNRTANVINLKSNVLSNRAIIHQLDNYLQYREN